MLTFVMLQSKAFCPDDDKMFLYHRSHTLPVTYSLDNINKITFSDDSITIWNFDNSTYQYFCDDLLWISFGVISDLYGDVNCDGKVDISDIVFVINTIAGNADNIKADVNGDSNIDISDVVSIINIIANL